MAWHGMQASSGRSAALPSPFRVCDMMRMLTLASLLSHPALAAAGKFDKYTTCDACIEAGWGWNVAKGKCGAFPNKVCDSSVPPPPPYDGTVVALTDATFEKYMKDEDIVVVEFYAPWYAPLSSAGQFCGWRSQ